MDKTMKGLFGYQKFAQNEHLNKLINDAENMAGSELALDDLDLVNAAGVHGRESQFKPEKPVLKKKR